MMTKKLTDCMPCDNGVLEHPRFFPRQMITAADLTQEQAYWRDKQRRHNRYLHGWGVVCGAQVEPVEGKDWTVRVTPGYILGPYGDEILIDCHREVDLKTTGIACKGGDPAGEAADPWCTPAKVSRKPETSLYVAVSYCEFPTRPVRIQPNGCGCDDGQCENSRWHDGYQIHVLTKDPCPPSGGNGEWPSLNARLKDLQANGGAFAFEPLTECPPCPSDPWVALAKVTLKADGLVTIDNCKCRRMVVSLAHAWWMCEDATPPQAECVIQLTLNTGDTENLTPGTKRPVPRGEPLRVFTVTGTELVTEAVERSDIAFISGEDVNAAADEKIVVQLLGGGPGNTQQFFINVAAEAALGPRTLRVKTPKGVLCTLKDVIDIK